MSDSNKISPDINDDEIGKIVQLVINHKIQGIIVSNTTDSNRDTPLILKHEMEVYQDNHKDISTNLIKKFYKETKGKVKIIGFHGVDQEKVLLKNIIELTPCNYIQV